MMRLLQHSLLFGLIYSWFFTHESIKAECIETKASIANVTEVNTHEAAVSNCSQDENAFKYNGKCFWIIANYSASHLQSYYVTRSWCQTKGGDVGNVYSKEHFEMIEKVALLKMRSWSLNFWTNMTYELKTKKVFLGNLEEAPYVRWYWWFPTQFTDHIGIKIHLSSYPSEYNQGFYNRNLRDGSQGVLCEAVIQ